MRARLRERELTVKSAAAAWRTHPALHVDEDGARAPRAAGGLGQLNDYACGAESAMDAWLDDKAVQAALHVTDDKAGMRYKQTCGDLRGLYAQLIPQYRVLIYSGNVDACVPTWGSEQWTRELGYEVETEWHPWTSDSASPGSSRNVQGGYAVTYKTNAFTFATVKGAGHEVPRYKPEFALTMIKRFLAGKPL